jgi:hypothetical protein
MIGPEGSKIGSEGILLRLTGERERMPPLIISTDYLDRLKEGAVFKAVGISKSFI